MKCLDAASMVLSPIGSRLTVSLPTMYLCSAYGAVVQGVLGWAGLGWAGLGWAGLGWFRLCISQDEANNASDDTMICSPHIVNNAVVVPV